MKTFNEIDRLVRAVLQKRNPNPECIVCGKKTGWASSENPNGLQVGHYFSRNKIATRFDLENVFPQCYECNANHNINPEPMKQAIINKYGYERLYKLEQKVKNHVRFTPAERKQIAQDLIDELDKQPAC